MNVSIKGKNLLIEIPLQEPQASKTGKTLVIASTRGLMRTNATLNGQPITIGVNAIIPISAAPAEPRFQPAAA